MKQERAARLMEVQQSISEEINNQKVGKVYKTLIDTIESGYFVGRTEADSPEVDNEVLILADKFFLRVGDFAQIRITAADAFDLYGEPVPAA